MKNFDRSTSVFRSVGRSHLLALEPRMMFDAAIAATTEAVAKPESPLDRSTPGDSGSPAHVPVPIDAFTPPASPAEPVRTDAADAGRPIAATASAAANSGTAQHDATTLAAFDGDASDRGVTRTPVDPSHDLSDGSVREPATPSGHAIVFIDTAVDDYRQLAEQWASQAQVVLIDGTRDGIDQIRAALAGQSDISAIHIVSHGEQGEFWIGTTKVDQAAIAGDLASSLAAIGRSLEPGGDILIYGCDFAEGDAGAAALASFARATGADVAASTDLTGYASRGADWVLEAHVGSIETRSLDGGDWAHTLDPNTPVPISVTADSLTVTNGAGTVVVKGATGYGKDSRSPDVGVGAVARWSGAATFNGQSIDLLATVVSLSTGDAVAFNRPTGTGANGDDPTFLLRDLTTGASDATVQIRWSLVFAGTTDALPADIRFTIADIDGIGGNPNTRESVSTSTDNLAYYTRERVTDIAFTSSLDRITASGTQNENTDPTLPVTSKSAATFDWTKVSSFDLTYTLTTNTVTTQAQFYQDGDADFAYSDPVYISIPRLDLDGDDSTALGNDAHFTFTENGPGVPVVDSDVVVSNPMDINSVVGASVTLTNYQSGDILSVGTLPSNITASVGAVNNGRIVVTLTGAGSETDYDAALTAIRFSNSSDTPDTTQRVLTVSFSNDTLTSAVATSRIDVVPVNDPPIARDDSATTAEDTAVTIAVLGNDTDPDGDPLVVTAASALHGSIVRNADGTLTYTPDANYNGSDTISYAISDGQGGVSNAVVAVTITPVNDAPNPVGILPDRASSDGASVSYATAGGFGDVDGDTLSYVATGLPAGLTIDATTGVISGAIDRSASQVAGGTYAIVVTARDPSNATTTQRFTLTATNPAPTAVNDSATTTEDTAVAIAVLGNDTDPDGDPLVVTAASALHGSVVRNADGTLTYTPDANYNGSDTISYAISDGQGGVSNAVVAVTIAPVNDAPNPVGILPDRASSDGASVSYATAGGFGDVDGDTLSYAATGLSAGLTIDATTGVISGTIDRSASQVAGGTYAIVVTARDPSDATTTQRFTLTATNPAPTAVNDSATTAEDTAVTVAVLGNDTDPDGDPLVVTAASALHGSVVRNADGTLTYTPDANYNGSDTISYAISDGQGGVSNAVVAVTITPVNDAPNPIGSLPDRASSDGASVSYATAGGFGDVDGDTLSYVATGLPAGLTIDATTGVISGTIDRSASQVAGGTYAIVVTARDPSNATTTQRFTLTATNPAPTARNDSAIAHVDTPTVIAVLGNDTDPDGDPLTVTDARAGSGTVAILGDGTLRYTPPAGFAGRDTIVYTISDGQGGTATATVEVTIGNLAPTTGAGGNQAAQDGQAVSLPVGASVADADGDPLTFTATGLPAGLTIDRATGLVSGIVDGHASQVGGGLYDTVVTADDGHGGTSTTLVHWTITNPAPVARDDTASVDEDGAIVIAPLANDADPDGDALSIVSAVAAHGTVTINADGTIAYRPDTDFNGTDTIAYVVADGDGGRASASIVVTVAPRNDSPTTTGLPARSDTDAESIAIPAGAVFGDVDGDVLTYSATGLPPGLSINPATGAISGTIAPGAYRGGSDGQGHYTAIVTATDPSGLSVDARFTWTVVAAGPIARPDTATTREDVPVTIPVLANDSDPEGDPLTLVEAVASHGTATIVDNALVFTPDKDFNGTALITYQVSDPAGNRTSASVTVTVVAVNDAPIAEPLSPATGKDGQVVTLDVGGFFTDPDGDALRFTATGLPAGLTIDPATGRIAGTIDRSASQLTSGVYRVVVTATDPSGASASSAFDWAIANPAPAAANDSATTAEDVPVRIVVLGNDVDPDGDPLGVVTATAGHGAVVINADGTLGYTPDQDFNGNDVIVYTISDGQGGTASASVLVTITPVQDPPRAIDDRATLVQDRTIDIPVLGNDSDPDGDPLTVVAATATSGSVTINADGTLHYVPVAGFVGTDVIRYTIDDGQGGTASAMVAVTVTPVNTPPIALNDAARTNEDNPVTIAVLGNDTDRDGDPLEVTGASAAHGSVVVNADGTLTYTPDANYAGSDTLRYTIADGRGGTASAEVAITIDPVNDAPVAVGSLPDRMTGDGAAVAYPTAAAFTDVDGDTLTYTATGLPVGLTIDAATGVVSGTIDRGASQVDGGRYGVIVTARDPAGATASQAFAITATNAPPIARDDRARTDEERGVVIPVLANDSDPDGNAIAVTGAVAAHGSVTINADGTLAYVPGPSFAGIDTIRYTITDRDGGTATALVTVTVDPVNHAPVTPTGTAPIDVTGGRPTRIAVLDGVTDRDGDPLTLTGATTANGVVVINPDNTLTFSAQRGFVGNATITYTVADGRGGVSTGTVVVRVADGRGADIEQLLDFGRPRFVDPTPRMAIVRLGDDGEARNPLAVIETVEGIRSLASTTIGRQPVGDAVDAIRSLRGISIDPDTPILAEVARLDAIRDQRDAGDRLFDHRWGDFMVKGLTGFSAAADRNAGIMVESVVRGGAIYVEVRDTAENGHAAIRSIDVRLATGHVADFIHVDPRGLAIIERAADMDELHLVVRVTRENGRTTSTPIVVQGQTGEIELDHPAPTRHRAAPLDATLHTPGAAASAAAARLSSTFE